MNLRGELGPGRMKRKDTADPHIAEIYDQVETQLDDLELIRRLIGSRTGQRIFEPFCGTGRLAIPLAQDGHRVIGMDEADAMLDRCRAKQRPLPADAAQRLTLIHREALATDWPAGMDLVLLGGNCFYELESADEQRQCIERAAQSLKPGGFVFVDNDDHGSETLAESWQHPRGHVRKAFPSGVCADGTHIDGFTETRRFDVHRRLVHYVRRAVVTSSDGRTASYDWAETCHPVLEADVERWLVEASFTILSIFGDRAGRPHGPGSPRAIFWASR